MRAVGCQRMSTSLPVQPNARIALIEAVKGLGIILVVAAHLVKFGTPGVPDWYTIFKFKVYLFHMPLLMFMSGYVFRYANHHVRGLSDFSGFAGRRANRLLVPFLVIGVITIFGKWFSAMWFSIDEAPSGLASGLMSIFINTESSPVLTIWYLFVLFVYCLVTPVLFVVFRKHWSWLGLFALALYFIRLDDILYANRIVQYYVFFVAGCIAADREFLQRFSGSSLSVSVAAMAGFMLLLMFPWNREYGLLVCGLLSCLAVPALIDVLPERMRAMLGYFGSCSMTIYLLNVIFIGIAKVAYDLVFPPDYQSFGLLLAVTFVAGLFGPILLKITVDSVPTLNKTVGKYLS
jgi:fucose 4-O-acetylase-like acetyltransferase